MLNDCLVILNTDVDFAGTFISRYLDNDTVKDRFEVEVIGKNVSIVAQRNHNLSIISHVKYHRKLNFEN